MTDTTTPTLGDDENLIINLDEDDAPPAAAGKPPPVPGPGATAAPSSQGLEDMRRQMNAERERADRVTAQAQQIARERDEAIRFAQEAERRGVSTYELYNENQIKATTDKMASLAAGVELAMQDGDFKRAAAYNLELGRLGGALAVLERDQAVLQQQREQAGVRPAARQQQPQQPQAPQASDPMERAIQGRSEPTRNFLRKHPELVRGDGTLKRAALDAHERALDEGFQADTPGYFEFIEKSLTAQQPGHPAPPRNAPTMAAPVSRGGGPGAASGGGGGTFVMTPKMRRLAEEQGVPPAEWARNYVRLLAEGRITPIT